MKTTTITFTTSETKEEVLELKKISEDNEEIIKKIVSPIEKIDIDIKDIPIVLEKLSNKELLMLPNLMAVIVTAEKSIKRDIEIFTALNGFVEFVSNNKKQEENPLKDLARLLDKLNNR